MIDLYTASTPNGRKISIALETFNLPYKVHPIDLSEGEQKKPWFLKMNPNGRIPVIVDQDNDDYTLFESGAILLYLAEKSGQGLPQEMKARHRVIQWVMFQMSGVGPMQGQWHVFNRYFDEHLPAVIERYERETKRLYQVLDDQLAQTECIAGEFSIADIALWPWVHSFQKGDGDLNAFPHLNDWFKRLEKKPSFQKGNQIPPDETDEDKKRNTGKNILV